MEITRKQNSNQPATLVALVTFTATGLGVALPGALLPSLLTRWSMSDERAGVLLFLFFFGSTSGALLSRGSLKLSVTRGCALTAVAAACLALASPIAAFGGIAIYGVGLGITMTSVSLLQSRRFPAERATQMARLNLLWSVGAILGPLVLLRGAATRGVAWVLVAISLLFGLLSVLVIFFVRSAEAESRDMSGWWKQARRMPVALLALVPLAVGVESAAGSWLATFSKRNGNSLAGTIGAISCFWAGMLLSRLLQSHRGVGAAINDKLLRFAPFLIALSLCVIILSGEGPLLPMGALFAGIGIGPMYPLLLAIVLQHGEAGNAVFVLAGCGAALLPLLTGLVSGWSGSLRAGLGVPLACTAMMLVCGWLVAGRGVQTTASGRHDGFTPDVL